MENRFRLALAILLAGLLALVAKNVLAQMSLVVYPRFCQAPCTIRTVSRIDRSPDNRFWSLAWASENYTGSHEIPIDNDSPVQFVFDIKEVPAGVYAIQTCVYNPKRRCVLSSVEVLGR